MLMLIIGIQRAGVELGWYVLPHGDERSHGIRVGPVVRAAGARCQRAKRQGLTQAPSAVARRGERELRLGGLWRTGPVSSGQEDQTDDRDPLATSFGIQGSQCEI